MKEVLFSVFSFHAVKNLTTAEGGALTWKDRQGLDNPALYHELQLLSLHGQSKDALAKTKFGAWEYDIVGPYYKCNMTDMVKHIHIAFSDDVHSLLQHWSSRLGTAVSQLTQNSFGEVCLADQGENVIEECLSEIEFALHYKRLLYAVDLLAILEEETQTLDGVEWNAGEVRNRMEALADAIGTVEIEDDEQRLQLVQYLWEDHRDWELGWHVLVGLIKGDEEIDWVRKAVEEDDSLSVFWISLLLRFALYEELDVFLSSHGCQAFWYTIAIEDALKAGSYVRVITLSQRALERFPRITLWDTYLYDASIKAGRDDITRELAFRYARQGYTFFDGTGKVAYFPDSVVQKPYPDCAENSQLLIHEVGGLDVDRQALHHDGHSSAFEVAQLAKTLNAQALLLVHLPPSKAIHSAIFEEASGIFPTVRMPMECSSFIVS